MPISPLANPGAPSPFQLGQASLISAFQTSPTDPTQIVSPQSMDPSQQQVQDAQNSPTHPSLVHAYQQRLQSARTPTASMMNRSQARTPMTQQIQQARQGGNAAYAESPYAGMETHPNMFTTVTVPTAPEAAAQATARGIGASTAASDQGAAITGLSGLSKLSPDQQNLITTMHSAGLPLDHILSTYEQMLNKAQEQSDKVQADFQKGSDEDLANRAGTGKDAENNAKEARAEASSVRADQRLTLSEARDTVKQIEADPAYQSLGKFDPRRLNGDDIATYNNAKQAVEGTFAPKGTSTSPAASTGVKAIPAHPEGVEVVDNTTGKRYVVQNGQYVEKQ